MGTPERVVTHGHYLSACAGPVEINVEINLDQGYYLIS